jgi:hypothetical protein
VQVNCEAGLVMQLTFGNPMNASAFVSRVRPNETLVTGGVHRGCAASVDVTNTSSLSVRTVLRRVVSILNVAGAEVTLSTSRVDHAAVLKHARASFRTSHFPADHFTTVTPPKGDDSAASGRQLAPMRGRKLCHHWYDIGCEVVKAAHWIGHGVATAANDITKAVRDTAEGVKDVTEYAFTGALPEYQKT